MTPEAINLVRNSWSALDTEALVQRFYENLFAEDPTLRQLFHGESEILTRKFALTLSEIIAQLDNPTVITEHVRKLGADHAQYGVYPRHYALVEKALNSALREVVGCSFDEALECAWHDAYWVIANGMQDGAMDDEPALGR